VGRYLLLCMMIAYGAARADDGAPQAAPGQGEGAVDLRPGFKALDTLAALKAASDARQAACLNAFGARRFCVCLNGRLSLDLSFDDYIVLVTKHADDPAWLSLPAKTRGLAGEARAVRDRCVDDAGGR
jgi:hypothetical protein